MPVRQIIGQGRVPVKIYTDEIDAGARRQLVNLSQLAIIHHHVAAMPDAHADIGATVGTVIATRRAIIPAAVGVDIGCGMIAARTSLTADNLDERSLRRVFCASTRNWRNASRARRTGCARWARWAAAITSSKSAWMRPAARG